VSWRPRWRRPPRRGKGFRDEGAHTPVQHRATSTAFVRLSRPMRSPGRKPLGHQENLPHREGGNRAGALPAQARISTTPVRSRPLSTHSDSPGGRLPQKVVTISVSHGHALPPEFSVTASKQQTRNHGADHPKGFHPQKRCITGHQPPSTKHSVTTTCTAPLKRSLLK